MIALPLFLKGFQVVQQTTTRFDAGPFAVLARPMEDFMVLRQLHIVRQTLLQFVAGVASVLPPTVSFARLFRCISAVHQD